MKRWIWGLAASTSLAVLALSALQDFIIYHPRRYSDHGLTRYYEEAKANFPQMKTLRYRDANTGEQVQTSYFIPARNVKSSLAVTHSRQLWVFFGGNAQLALDWLHFITTLRQHASFDSHEFLLFEYPGYGENFNDKVWLSEENAHSSVHAAIQAATTPFVGEERRRVKLVAHSIGCAVALHYASKHPKLVDGVVLISPFTSIPQMALDIFFRVGGLNEADLAQRIARFLVKRNNHWDNLERIRELGEQSNEQQQHAVVVIHGDRDEIVPIEQGRRVFARTQDFPQAFSTKYVEVWRGDHNSIVHVASQTIIQEGMSKI